MTANSVMRAVVFGCHRLPEMLSFSDIPGLMSFMGKAQIKPVQANAIAISETLNHLFANLKQPGEACLFTTMPLLVAQTR